MAWLQIEIVVVDSLSIVTLIMGFCNCSMLCCALLYVHTTFANILIGALLSLSSWCLVFVVRLLLAVPWVCLQFVIVVFPDHTHLLFLHQNIEIVSCLKVSELNQDMSQRQTKGLASRL